MWNRQLRRFVGSVRGGLAVTLLALASCNPFAGFINNTSSLGGDIPGQRSTVQVAFINNTPYFASFTFGAWDPLNEDRAPQFDQFFADADHPDQRLERNSTSEIFSFQCPRQISLGSAGLIDAILDRDDEADEDTLEVGVTFSDKLLDDPDALTIVLDDFVHQDALLGVEYNCDSLVYISFELDDSRPQGIRVDVRVVLNDEPS